MILALPSTKSKPDTFTSLHTSKPAQLSCEVADLEHNSSLREVHCPAQRYDVVAVLDALVTVKRLFFLFRFVNLLPANPHNSTRQSIPSINRMSYHINHSTHQLTMPGSSLSSTFNITKPSRTSANGATHWHSKEYGHINHSITQSLNAYCITTYPG